MATFKTKYIHGLSNLLFFLILMVFWRFFYVNHLLQKEQMQLCLLSWDYLLQHLSVQGGLAIYLGEFINQFFWDKWLAALSTSIVLWQISWASQKVLGRLVSKQVYPLSFLPAIGYTFILLNSYFEFSGSIAFMLSLWSVYAYLRVKKPNHRLFVGVVLLLLNYWFLGGAYIVFACSVIVAELIIRKRENQHIKSQNCLLWVVLIYCWLGLLIPLAAYKFLLTDHLLSSYMSRAYYQFSFLFPHRLIVLFLALPALLFYYALLQSRFSVKIQKVLNGVFIIGVFGFLLCGLYIFPNYDEEQEMHFDNLLVKQQWEAIIILAEKKQTIGEKGKLALSLALAQTGQMSEKLFQFNPGENDFFIPFMIKGQAPKIANEPYFYLGLNNFSKMLCFESIESTPNEKMPVRTLKRLVENYIIDGQYKVAERYLWHLEQTLFYRKWAKETRTYLFNDEKVNQHQLWGKLRRQKTHDDFYFQYDRNDVALLTLLRSNQQNKLAYEYLMNWYLLRKDFDEFLKYLPLADKMGYHKFPLVFQEALAYVITLFDEVPEGIEQYPISKEVRQRLDKYARAFQQGGSQKPDEMKKQFGDTYWFYVHFIKTADE